MCCWRKGRECDVTGSPAMLANVAFVPVTLAMPVTLAFAGDAAGSAGDADGARIGKLMGEAMLFVL